MNKVSLVIMVLFTKLFLTLVPIAIKYTQANIWTIGIFRLAIACCFFAIIVKKKFLKNYKKILILGPLFFIHWITYFMAIKTSTPSTAVIGLSSYGILLLLYSKFFFKIKIGAGSIFSILFALSGTFLIVDKFTFESSSMQGLLWGMTSAAAYALLPIIHQKNPAIPTTHKAFSQFLGAFIIFLILGFPQTDWNLETKDYSALIYLAIGGTILGHGMWVKVTETLKTTTTSAIYYLAIPLSMILEYIILDIAIGTQKIIGSMMVIVGNFMILYMQKKGRP